MTDPGVSANDSIEIRRWYKAPRNRVVTAFTSRPALEKWFAPDGRTTIHVDAFDFREGGAFHIRYRMPDGNTPSVGGMFTTINLPDELSFTWVWDTPDPHAGFETLVRFRFADRDGGTEVLLTHCRLETEDTRTRHFQGWSQTLDCLENHLAT